MVSPYDIRQSGFSGGGINAVTKSGSNRLTGSAFFFGRNEAWIGKGVTNTPVSEFADKQGGFSVGGAIAQNKVFFFGNMDWGRRQTPTGFCITGCPQAFRGSAADVDRFFSILENKYGYTIPDAQRAVLADDGLGQVHREVRLQPEAESPDDGPPQLRERAERHRQSPAPRATLTPDGFYQIRSKTNSTVAQLNSTLGKAVNEFRVAFTTIRDRRAGQPFEDSPFPRISVRLPVPASRINAGRENFSTANELDQDIIEVHDDYTMIKGKHTITLGTHNEFFGFRNLFIRDNYGTYTFNSLDSLRPGTGAAVRLQLLGDAGPAAGRAVRREPARLLRG